MSRDEIIQAIRQNKPALIPMTEKENDYKKIQLGVLEPLFKQSIEQAGAGLVRLDGEDKVVPYIKDNHWEAPDFDDPEIRAEYASSCTIEKLDKVNIALLSGQFGVAEKGAIWIDEISYSNRIIPFIVQQLVIRLSVKNLVADMHEAYRKINLNNTGFGVFISGPSKTADIELKLVYGAHGPKKLIVILF